jgi:hypothetical protein
MKSASCHFRTRALQKNAPIARRLTACRSVGREPWVWGVECNRVRSYPGRAYVNAELSPSPLRNGVQGSSCTAAILSCRCPLWVRIGHHSASAPCPLYPRKRTLIDRIEKSPSLISLATPNLGNAPIWSTQTRIVDVEAAIAIFHTRRQ